MGIAFDQIEQLVDALKSYPSVSETGLSFPPVSEARFHRISDGTVTWDWCERHSGERGLRGALSYYDLDDQIVAVNVAFAGHQVTEIELWRGDDAPIMSLPKSSDLWEMEPGKVYSPRT